MSDRAKWEEIRSHRGSTGSRRRGYQEAENAFELGARVRAERERLGLTQEELARRMGTSQPSVARLEAGGVAPTLDTLYRVADSLGLELVVDFRKGATA
jgi:ribosome-binding protein aMBF1 (putative translation factor)